MKYTYNNKKTYKIKNRLKIFLTIFLAVLISTTGYLISTNTFSKKYNYINYFNKTTKDGINISILGKKNSIPDNTTLKVKKIFDNEEVLDTIDDIRKDNSKILESYVYDIKILDKDNNEIEPTEDIKIVFLDEKIENENLNINIYHTTTNDNNELETEKLESEVVGDTVTATTDSFSYYTVEFTYNNLEYSLEGDSEVKLSKILEEIGLVGEVSEVEGSNDSLFSFEKKNGEWYVIAHQAFNTTEWMKVTIDDIVYEVVITDDLTKTVNMGWSLGYTNAPYLGQAIFTYTESLTDTTYSITLLRVVYKNTSSSTVTFQALDTNFPLNDLISPNIVVRMCENGNYSDLTNESYIGSVGVGSSVTLWSGSKTITLTRPNKATLNSDFDNYFFVYAHYQLPGSESYKTYAGQLKFSPPALEWTVSFDANGGVNAPAPIVVSGSDYVTINVTPPTRDGYVFKGWSTSSTGDVEVKNGGTTSIDKNTILYAVWKKKYTITKKWSDGLSGSAATNRAIPVIKLTRNTNYSPTTLSNQTCTDDWEWIAWDTTADVLTFTYNLTENEDSVNVTMTKVQYKNTKSSTVSYSGDTALEFYEYNSSTPFTTWSGSIASGGTTTIWTGSKTVTIPKPDIESTTLSAFNIYAKNSTPYGSASDFFFGNSGSLNISLEPKITYTSTADVWTKVDDTTWTWELEVCDNTVDWYVWEETVPDNYTSNHPVSSPVQISNDAASITNTVNSPPTLTISETVKGNIGDINKNFAFTLNVLDNGTGISGGYEYGGTRSGTLTFTNGNATFNLKHGENIIIELPRNCTYTINQNSSGYTLAKTNDSGTLNDDIASTFTDTLTSTTPTGIFLDLIPFIILIIIGVFGIVLIKRLKYI